VTTAGFEEDIRPSAKTEIAFNQFAADNVKLFSSRIVLVNMRPFTTRRDVNDPDSNSSGARQIPAKTVLTHFNRSYVVDADGFEHFSHIVCEWLYVHALVLQIDTSI
jgi:hypothetical protein